MAEIELNNDKGTQLELSVIEQQNSSITDSVIEQKTQAIQRYLNRTKTHTIACVNTYFVKGKYEYFRLSYRSGRKVKHIHLRGGNTSSKVAKYRADRLQEMIDRGAELEELIAQAETFNNK